MPDQSAAYYSTGFLRGLPLPTPLGRPEVDGPARAAYVQSLPQRFRRRIEPAPDRLGRLALSWLQHPSLSLGNALDVADVFLQEFRTLAGRASISRLAKRNDAERGHLKHLLVRAGRMEQPPPLSEHYSTEASGRAANRAIYGLAAAQLETFAEGCAARVAHAAR